MTIWSELTARDKQTDLPEAIRPQLDHDDGRSVVVNVDLEDDGP